MELCSAQLCSWREEAAETQYYTCTRLAADSRSPDAGNSGCTALAACCFGTAAVGVHSSDAGLKL